jgi:hypothetical protein
MAWFALPLLIGIAFGGMALAAGWSERAEERRILARAEAILARTSIALDAPGPDELAAPAEPQPEPASAAAPPERQPPVAPRGRVRSAA